MQGRAAPQIFYLSILSAHSLVLHMLFRTNESFPCILCNIESELCHGFGQESDESRTAAAGLFGVMAGPEITPDEIQDGSYVSKMKEISAAEWVNENPIPTVVAYGTCDRIQPFLASIRLKNALEANGVDYKYYELPHSGHGLQNDSKISRQWMEAVEEYLDKYMPVE